jgi:hypothetical protein
MVMVDLHEVFGRSELTQIAAADRAASPLVREHLSEDRWRNPVLLRPDPK